MLKAIVFDFDGVLANSEPLHYQAFRHVLSEQGLTLDEVDYYARYLGFDDAGAFRAILNDRGHRWSDARVQLAVARKAVVMEDLERDVSVLFAHADEVVRRAAARFPLAIASGALSVEIRRVLDREALTPCFAAIVGADDTEASKPAPDPYLLALAQLRSALGDDSLAPTECVAIEDSRWGLESARAAGLRTVGVAQTYPASALDRADLVIESIADLDLAALEKLCS